MCDVMSLASNVCCALNNLCVFMAMFAYLVVFRVILLMPFPQLKKIRNITSFRSLNVKCDA